MSPIIFVKRTTFSVGASRVRCFLAATGFAISSAAFPQGAPPAFSTPPTRGTFNGILKPARDVSLPARAIGVVEKFGFEEGQFVTKDALLVQLNADVERAEVDRAKAVLGNASKEVERTAADLARIKALRADDIGSVKELQDAQSLNDSAVGRKTIAELELAVANAKLKDKSIFAAFPGLLVRRFKEIGEAVERNESVVRVMDVSKLYLEIYAGADLIGKFAEGQTATLFTIDERSTKGSEIPAVVSRVDPEMMPETRTIRIKFQTEPSEKIRVGTEVILQLPSEVH
ncbi:MAG: efflux RND transporter periplasmic adaptor subunit [Opitutaceae bacterium]